ncbi:Gfo/Idh/MocA family protein [Pedobacter frigoris]|uniref:Gfo/Idh/MocA family oxidoreductase n=1 Tax=Pedobacter frigoris TaxID=2571272 RepID=A0A4U1CLG1_9SPHI|nr:Gfo/Idh/MocA family oxidoreductase [Pedobacter frigoris]TKC06289.1 Gfo/Idh/MocA family oxidoreductase [Pedobacter frigoris]
MSRKSNLNSTDRRSFLKKTGLIAMGSTLAYHTGYASPLFPSAKPKLKVGLVGCGGRGTGAASQALKADPDVVITALADIFEDRLESAYTALKEIGAKQVKVDQKNKFIGFDAFQRLIDSGVDVVLLTTPPSFRPDHLTAAIHAGKHVFCEKPVAVDAPGIRKVLEAAKLAKEKNLSLVSGFCFRYDLPSRATMAKVLNGDIGEIRSISTFRNGAGNWSNPRQPDWTDLTYKLRNWHYHNWLSGDFIVEQAVHSLDLMSWAMGDQLPVRATGTGGRQVRTDEIFGNIYDHFAIEFEYANGAKGYHFCRQQEGTSHRNTMDVLGTDGSAMINVMTKQEITGKNKWVYSGEKNNMYQTQHNELFEGIRNGKPINQGVEMANSTMLAIWGRMVAYSGQTLTWDQALNSNQTLGPAIEKYNWDLKWEDQPVALPGITKVI